MAANQFLKPGVCTIVTDDTLSAGYWVRATALGVPDELIDDVNFYQYLISASGAVLEAASDGLRLSASALGAGLAGGGANKAKVQISKQATKAITDTDLVLFEDGIGNLWSTTRIDVVSGGPIAPYSLMGNNTAGNKKMAPITFTDLPLGTLSSGVSVIGWTSGGTLQKYQIGDGAVTNLGNTPAANSITISSSNGDDTVLPAATSVTAGVFTANDYNALYNLVGNPTDLSVLADVTTVRIINTTGNDAYIGPANAFSAGVMTAAMYSELTAIAAETADMTLLRTASNNSIQLDWYANSDTIILPAVDGTYAGLMTPTMLATLNALDASTTDLGITKSATQNEITNTVGTNAIITLVDATNAGLMSPTQRTQLINLDASSIALTGTPSPTTYNVQADWYGTSDNINIPLVDDTNSGLMSPSQKALLESISTGSTNLSTTYGATSVTIVNSVGLDAVIGQASGSTAGVMTSTQHLFLQDLYGASSNSVLLNDSAVGDVPQWNRSSDLTLYASNSSTRLLGWDSLGRLGVFQPASGGSGTPENVVAMTGHSLTANDIGKPVVQGAVWNDVSSDSWPTGILTEIVDANNVKLAIPGMMIEIPSELIPPGYNPSDLADGRWLWYDTSAGTYVAARPSDTVGDFTELIEVLEANPADPGGYLAIWHDFGPLGAGSVIDTGGGGGGGGDVYLSAGVPDNAEAVNYAAALDTTNNDVYWSNGSSWTKLRDGWGTEVDAVTIDADDMEVIQLSYTTPVVITSITNGEQNQILTLISLDDNASVQHNTSIRLNGSENWTVGTDGGTLTLRFHQGNWYEMGRADLNAPTYLVAN